MGGRPGAAPSEGPPRLRLEANNSGGLPCPSPAQENPKLVRPVVNAKICAQGTETRPIPSNSEFRAPMSERNMSNEPRPSFEGLVLGL